MLRSIHLHGEMQDRFGGPFCMDVEDTLDAVRGLGCQIKGFQAYIMANNFHVVVGDIELDEETLAFQAPGDIHITPAIEGAGGRGASIAKMIGGAAFAAAAWWALPAVGGFFAAATVKGSLAMMGVSIALQGASGLLSRPELPDTSPSLDEKERRRMGVFQGALNPTEQGIPVPLVYGRAFVRPVIISAGTDISHVVL